MKCCLLSDDMMGPKFCMRQEPCGENSTGCVGGEHCAGKIALCAGGTHCAGKIALCVGGTHCAGKITLGFGGTHCAGKIALRDGLAQFAKVYNQVSSSFFRLILVSKKKRWIF